MTEASVSSRRRRRHSRSRGDGSSGDKGAASATKSAVASLRKRTRSSESSDSAARSWIRPLDWEGWLAVFTLLLGAGAFGFLLDPLNATAPVETAIWLLLYLTVFGLLWQRYKLRWLTWLLRNQPLLCAVLMVAAASWFWSIAPEFTWKRATHLLGTTLIAVWIGYHFASRTLMAVLFYAFVGLIVGSAVFALALPELGQHTYGGSMAWQGLTSNKNHLGFIAAIAIVFSLIGALFERLPLKAGLALAATSVLTLTMTHSATSIVVLAVGLAAVAVFLVSKRIGAPSILTLVLVLAASGGLGLYIATSQYVYDFTETLGRDTTFTNRTQLWRAAWETTLDRPWLGWGYGSIWSVSEDSAFIQEQLLDTPWTASHAHNGFLTVASELGFPAGVIAVLYALRTLIQATHRYVRRASAFSLFAIGFLFMFLVENISETWLFMHRDLFWMLFITIAVELQRGAEFHHRSDSSATHQNGGLRRKRKKERYAT